MSTDDFKTVALHNRLAYWHPEPGLAAGNQLFYSHPTYLAYRSIDNILGQSVREIFRIGLGCSEGFITPNAGAAATTLTRVGPPGDTLREVGRGRVDLSPGCFPRVYLDYLPPGPVQGGPAGDGTYSTSGSYGEVTIAGNLWGSDGTYKSVGHKFICQVANNPAQQASGSIYANQHSKYAHSNLLVPIWTDLSQSAPYTEGCIFDFQVYYEGAPRVLNCYIVEEPVQITFDKAYSSGSSAASYTEDGLIPDQILTSYPKTEDNADSEPRFGTELALSAVKNQQDRLGPMILSWTAWDESDSNNLTKTRPSGIVFDNQDEYEEINSLNLFTVLTSASAGYFPPVQFCQRFAYNDPEQNMFGKKAVLPVIVRAYMDVTGTMKMRMQSSDWTISDAEIHTHTYSDGWVEWAGFIEGDLYPHTFTPSQNVWIGLQALTTSGSATLYYLSVNVMKENYVYGSE